jgi:hypothetical protein
MLPETKLEILIDNVDQLIENQKLKIEELVQKRMTGEIGDSESIEIILEMFVTISILIDRKASLLHLQGSSAAPVFVELNKCNLNMMFRFLKNVGITA